jgi:hypothetical protein
MVKFNTNYSLLEVNNPNFDLVYIVSEITNRNTKLIDCTRLIEKEVKKGFLDRFNIELNLSNKKIHWYTQKNPTVFEALVIVMTK